MMTTKQNQSLRARVIDFLKRNPEGGWPRDIYKAVGAGHSRKSIYPVLYKLVREFEVDCDNTTFKYRLVRPMAAKPVAQQEPQKAATPEVQWPQFEVLRTKHEELQAQYDRLRAHYDEARVIMKWLEIKVEVLIRKQVS